MKTCRNIVTVGDVRDAKALSDQADARIELEQATLRAYPSIGKLSSGKYYAFIRGVYVETRDLPGLVSALA